MLYLVYCVAMGFNSKFEAWAHKSLPVPESWRNAGNAEKEGEPCELEAMGETEEKPKEEEEVRDPLTKEPFMNIEDPHYWI